MRQNRSKCERSPESMRRLLSHKEWIYPHRNWIYPHRNWIYPHRNWIYLHKNWIYLAKHWIYLEFIYIEKLSLSSNSGQKSARSLRSLGLGIKNTFPRGWAAQNFCGLTFSRNLLKNVRKCFSQQKVKKIFLQNKRSSIWMKKREASTSELFVSSIGSYVQPKLSGLVGHQVHLWGRHHWI